MIEIASLGSGSRGNATLVRSGSHCLLVDCGFNLKTFQSRCADLAFSPKQIDAILVTHEHSDHIGGVASVARKFDLPVYSSVGTWHAKPQRPVADLNYLSSHGEIIFGDLVVNVLVVPHDSKEATQFMFKDKDSSLAVLTDLGHIPPWLQKQVADVEMLLVEFNHCTEMLRVGPYPAKVQARVRGNYGHLSNQQALDLVASLNNLKCLIAGHISQQNNSIERVEQYLNLAKQSVEKTMLVTQEAGFDWISAS